MNFLAIKTKALQYFEFAMTWVVSPEFYIQLVAIIIAICLAWFVQRTLKNRVPLLINGPLPGSFYQLRKKIYGTQDLLLQILYVVFLGIAIQVVISMINQTWLVRIAQSLAVIFLLYSLIRRYIKNPFINGICRWVGIPLATLYVFGWLDDVIAFLDGIAN